MERIDVDKLINEGDIKVEFDDGTRVTCNGAVVCFRDIVSIESDEDDWKNLKDKMDKKEKEGDKYRRDATIITGKWSPEAMIKAQVEINEMLSESIEENMTPELLGKIAEVLFRSMQEECK